MRRPSCGGWTGDPGPRLLEAGTFEDRPYLLTEWCKGTDASVLAMHLRRPGDRASRGELLKLAVAIVRAYERLHELRRDPRRRQPP